MNKSYCLGIDTSNYKTSVAVVDMDGTLIHQAQKFLEVKKGERGLRQSVALFQHVNQLPDLVDQVLANQEIRDHLSVVSASSKPRPIENSYMPVFNAGVSAGKMLSSAFGAKYFEFSHQEGHIEAVQFYSALRHAEEFISFHFSGGTTECLQITKKNGIDIIGGSKDIAFGQLLDRIGVAMGMDFPCGEEMDFIASSIKPPKTNVLPPIKVLGGEVNLSGIETKAQRLVGEISDDDLVYMIFDRIAEAIVLMVNQFHTQYGITQYLFAGGVSSSKFIQNKVKQVLPRSLTIVFGDAALSADNAVGIALLGRKQLWP
ncbi:N6-L-threonylcarbamoyladenine synthase [Clostridiales Family XIII bacterium PM5-7]